MPSTYSPNLRIELIANGEQSGIWGSTTNVNLGTLLEQSISGYQAVTVLQTPSYLSAVNGGADQARNAALVVNESGVNANFEIAIPPLTKLYVVYNASSLYTAKIYVGSGLNTTTPIAGTPRTVTIPAGKRVFLICDGTNVDDAINDVTNDFTADQIVGITNLIPPTNATALPTSTLPTAIDSSTTSITLTDASSFATSGILMIDSEQITFAGKSTNTLTGCVRNVGGSGAVAHAANAVVTQLTNADMLTQSNITWNSGSEVLAVGAGDRTRFYVDTVSAQSLTNKTLLGSYVNGQYLSNNVAIPALAIDCSLGNYFTKSISTNSTFTVSNVPSQVYSMTVQLTTSSAAKPTWFANVYWPDNVNPSTSISNGVHLFMFVTNDGGTVWHGAALTNYTA